MTHKYTVTLEVEWTDDHDKKWAENQMRGYAAYLEYDDWFENIKVSFKEKK